MSTQAYARRATVHTWPDAITVRPMFRIGFVLLAAFFATLTVLPLLVLLKVSISAPQDIMTARPPFLIYNPTLEHWRNLLDPETLINAYLGSNWPFGINVIFEKKGRKDVKVYRGWRGPAKESHVLGGEMLGIPVGAPNRDGALKLADFLMAQETQSELLTKLGWPPMRTDAYGSAPEWQQPYFNAIQEAMQHVDARPNVPHWEEVSRAMNDAFRDVVQQKQPVKETLDRYAQQIQRAKQAAGG